MIFRRTVQAFTWSTVFCLAIASAHAQDITYAIHIKPLIEKQCLGCHGPGSPELPEFDKDKNRYKEISRGPRMDSYTYLLSFIGWPDTGALMRRLDDGKNTKDGKPGNMYQHLGATEEERQRNLRLLKEWVGAWTLKSWTDISKEEMSGFKLAY